MDNEVWIIRPIYLTPILVFIGVPILAVLAGLDAFLSFIYSHIDIIAVISIVISIILCLITLIFMRKPIFLLSIPSSALALSQFLYMLNKGSQAIYVMDDMHFAAIWRLIVFAIWLVYMLLNLLICFGGMAVPPLTIISEKNEKNKDYSLCVPSMVVCAIAGAVGWVMNLIFL